MRLKKKQEPGTENPQYHKKLTIFLYKCYLKFISNTKLEGLWNRNGPVSYESDVCMNEILPYHNDNIP